MHVHAYPSPSPSPSPCLNVYNDIEWKYRRLRTPLHLAIMNESEIKKTLIVVLVMGRHRDSTLELQCLEKVDYSTMPVSSLKISAV
jgi:hypothetical protein